jgi:probable phosphoglycerate mutase
MKGVLLGRTDPPLSETGRAQMTAVRLDVARIYASPLRRARESAELLGGPVVVLDDLAEIGLGAWDGRTWADIEAAEPEMAARKLLDWTGVTPPGGEVWRDFEQRIDRALGIVRQGAFPAAIVAHVAVNACIAHRICRAPALSFHQEYAQADAFEF